jgi:hypothetical protein
LVFGFQLLSTSHLKPETPKDQSPKT